MKRLFDFVISLLCLVLLSPLFLLFYVLIKCETKGGAIYRQERIGLHGRAFYIYKFRSMYSDAEKDGPQLLQQGSVNDDCRLTPIGRFLRAHHLDELPQLWNVLIGDMSFVGYRPERKVYIDRIMQHNARYEELYRRRPGVTSYATLYNGYTDTMKKMLRRLDYDLYYNEHQSFGLDMKILMKTFLLVASGKKF